MVTGNVRIALDAIKSAKWRSFLTMLGIIIGVVSVVTIVSIGEGVKRQITSQINQLGPDLITIRPGKTVTRDASGKITSVNYMSAFAGNAFNENDLRTVRQVPGVASVVPMSFVTATPKVENREFQNGAILGTTDALPDALNQEIEFGAFFGADESNKEVAVIGKHVAEELFQETVPIGRSMQIRGQNYVVLGVFKEFQTTTLPSSADYNRAIFIPFNAGKKLSSGQAGIQQILVKPQDARQADTVASTIQQSLQQAHAGQDDFTVLRQQDNLAIASSVLNLLTSLISGIAAISLIVGGIGIMNIMLASVVERTREIGVRKAVGATNHQILAQFVIESAVISTVGGLVGVLAAFVTNFFIRIFTDLQPVITPPIMFIAVVVSLIVGVLFGVAPALKAARKDPIQALRHM